MDHPTARRARALATAAGAAAALLILGACGDDGADRPAGDSDRAARTPRGWHTVRNRPAGVTLPAPASWRATLAGARTTIRSPDRLTAVSVAADHGSQGRSALPGEYASAVLEALPGFRGNGSPPTGHVPGSPYRSALVRAAGTVRASRRPQRIEIATFTRPGQATYTLVAFRNGSMASPGSRRVLARMRAGLRGQVPAQRSGRSG